MDLHELSFGKIIILHNNVAEVIINEGVEMDEELVNQFHDFLFDNLKSPFSLLINKINSYSYSFEALAKLGAKKEIRAIAVVAYTRTSKISTESIASFPKEVKWNMSVFSNRDEAIKWLMLEN